MRQSVQIMLIKYLLLNISKSTVRIAYGFFSFMTLFNICTYPALWILIRDSPNELQRERLNVIKNPMKLALRLKSGLLKELMFSLQSFCNSVSFFKYIGINIFLLLFFCSISRAQEKSLVPESVFREYSYKKMITPLKGNHTYFDSFQVVLQIDDLKDAIDAEVALNFWGGHIGTSDQTFKINGSKKFDFPQPKTPGIPNCYFRFNNGNPPVKIPSNLLKKGDNTFTFFCGKQLCYGFNWPHYWLNSFTVRVYYNKDRKNFVKGEIKKDKPGDTAYNLVGLETSVSDPSQVESVEYIGYYEDYDLDGDGRLAGWQYTINNGLWGDIIGKQYLEPYHLGWNNFWVPEQNRPIKIIAKINSKNGLSYFTAPIQFTKLEQANSKIKIYQTDNLPENFSSRIGQRKECDIQITDTLTNALSAYLVLSSWSGEPEDGALHMLGINGKMLAESPGKLHDWDFLKIPVPLEYLKTGDNTFFIYSETKEHMFEVNYPGPAILIRYSTKSKTLK